MCASSVDYHCVEHRSLSFVFDNGRVYVVLCCRWRVRMQVTIRAFVDDATLGLRRRVRIRVLFDVGSRHDPQ